MLLKEQYVFKFLSHHVDSLEGKTYQEFISALASEAIKSLYRNYRKIGLKK